MQEGKVGLSKPNPFILTLREGRDCLADEFYRHGNLDWTGSVMRMLRKEIAAVRVWYE